VSSRDVLDRFAKRWRYCWACGISPSKQSDSLSDWPRQLEIHHIMKHRRLHEQWNLSRLCSFCHRLAEGDTIKYNGSKVPNLLQSHVHWLKKTIDGRHYDWDRLVKQSRAGVPSGPEIVPDWFLLQFSRFRGGVHGCR